MLAVVPLVVMAVVCDDLMAAHSVRGLCSASPRTLRGESHATCLCTNAGSIYGHMTWGCVLV